MSDPVSNAEIEDVLSSIRRLVSVERRGDARLGLKLERQDQVSQDEEGDIENDAPLDDEVDQTDTPDVSIYADDQSENQAVKGLELGTTGVKLVLTPAQRVDEDSTPDLSLVQEAPDMPQDLDHIAQADAEAYDEALDAEASLGSEDDPLKAPEEGSDFVRLRPEVSAQELIARVASTTIPKAPHADNDDAWPREDLKNDSQNAELYAVADSDEVEDWSAEDLEEPETPAEEDTARSEQPTGAELEARIAEVEAAVAARTEQWDPDAPAQDEYAGGEVEPLPWEDHGADAAWAEKEEIVEEKSPEEVEAIEEAVVLEEAPQVAADTYLAPDPASVVNDTSTPDPVQQETRLHLSEVAMSDDVTEIVSEAVTEAATEAGADLALYGEETLLDEDALRELVGDIVRQELQGALGERITRNVRKLVRREIHRAMMGQDYD